MGDILKSNNGNNLNPPVLDPTQHISGRGQEYEVKTPSPEDLDSMWLRWKCQNCGYVYEGVVELKKCPKCGNENPDKFSDVE